MVCKLVLVALLAVGVYGRTAFNPYESYYDPYESFSNKVMAQYCNVDIISSEDASKVKSALKTTAQCLNGLVDRDTTIREFSEAVVQNDYTEVMKNYCAKTPALQSCLKHVYSGLAPCISPEAMRTEERVMDDLLEYACGNNGAKLVLFFKEDGIKCAESKMSVMSSCIESTDAYTKSKIGAQVNPATMGCKDRDQIMTCLVNGLKGCQNPVPATIAEDIREIVLKDRDCPEVEQIKITSVQVAESNTNQKELQPQNAEFSKQLELLKKRKLELEVRNVEIETWNRENELHVQHTVLTSDILTEKPATTETNQLE